jgi:hypothetical protein
MTSLRQRRSRSEISPLDIESACIAPPACVWTLRIDSYNHTGKKDYCNNGKYVHLLFDKGKPILILYEFESQGKEYDIYREYEYTPHQID